MCQEQLGIISIQIRRLELTNFFAIVIDMIPALAFFFGLLISLLRLLQFSKMGLLRIVTTILALPVLVAANTVYVNYQGSDMDIPYLLIISSVIATILLLIINLKYLRLSCSFITYAGHLGVVGWLLYLLYTNLGFSTTFVLMVCLYGAFVILLLNTVLYVHRTNDWSSRRLSMLFVSYAVLVSVIFLYLAFASSWFAWRREEVLLISSAEAFLAGLLMAYYLAHVATVALILPVRKRNYADQLRLLQESTFAYFKQTHYSLLHIVAIWLATILLVAGTQLLTDSLLLVIALVLSILSAFERVGNSKVYV